VSALQAFRRGLDTTSHNVANVTTGGYSRQRIETATREAQPYGNGWLGSGVNVTSVRRVYDDFVALNYRTTSSSYGQQDTLASLAERIDNLYADSTTGLPVALQKFVNALQGVASAPTSMSARQVMLAEANALAGQVNDYGSQLEQMSQEVNDRISAATLDINSLSTALADLNVRIVIAQNRSGQPPNDLLDQRDQLLNQLSEQVSVSTVRQVDGSLNVFIGNGQPLVLGTRASTLVTQPSEFDGKRAQVAVQTPSGAIDVTSSLTGGKIGGLLEARDRLLEPARNSLGQLAAGIADLVNAQQHKGMDLNGAAGADLFTLGPVDVLTGARNSGTAAVAVARSDVASLTAGNYRLDRTATGWSLRRIDTGTAVAMTGSGTAADPFVADGLSVVVSGTAATGDAFEIQPTRKAAASLGVVMTDPSRLAAALPVNAAPNASNGGTAKVNTLSVTDASNPALRNAATITFLTATAYSIDGGPSQAFVPGQSITANGWSLQLDGAPAAGDSFAIASNANGVGDNRNFLVLSTALSQPYLDGGTTSINGALGRIVADIGVQTRQAQVSRDALAVVQRDAVAARDSVSGVNLDEEAANLIRYQQAYQAAAQVIQVANTTFDTLLGALRR
jgi:flagellar hook-associated protein 1 FlgK